MEFDGIKHTPVSFHDGLWHCADDVLKMLCYYAADIGMELGNVSNKEKRHKLLLEVAELQVNNLHASFEEMTGGQKEPTLHLVKNDSTIN